ncbi:MAG: tripartite tricarboxylate transporter substrate binding protein [Betaproteobacteria bacterium]|nr:tripartite tricarboxylate transporter substrate binding protein [Betaproteobacteria bacterium]
MKRRSMIAAVAMTLAALTTAVPALAQSGWPNKPIKFMNPFPAGGGTDAFARPLAAKLSQSLGQQVIVENMGGAGGTVGASAAAKQAGDGYTFFIGAIHHTIAESLYPKLSYNLRQDFIPITVLGSVPNAVVVHPKTGFKTMDDLIKFAKANPGKLNYGSAGSGASHHIAAEMFKKMAGIDMTHVPYKGIGPMMQDLLAGQIDLAFDGMASSSPQIKGGKIIPLAVTSTKRSNVIPDVPTLQELGYKDYELTTWYAIWGIKGTPPEIINRMHAEVVKAMNDPDLKKIWEAQSATAGGQSPKEFEAFINNEITKWAKVIKDAGIKIDN